MASFVQMAFRADRPRGHPDPLEEVVEMDMTIVRPSSLPAQNISAKLRRLLQTAARVHSTGVSDPPARRCLWWTRTPSTSSQMRRCRS